MRLRKIRVNILINHSTDGKGRARFECRAPNIFVGVANRDYLAQNVNQAQATV